MNSLLAMSDQASTPTLRESVRAPRDATLSYVLVTPARNEEQYIELTIQSVVRQTVLPLRWVIVSDASTDRTDEIVRSLAARHPWIELVRRTEQDSRNFAGKVACLNAGLKRVSELSYDVIGCLDADISFDEGYFDYLLKQFAADAKLGLAGTPFSENGKTYDYRYSSRDHVSGACQLFRKQCYEQIGGYTPLKGGGIDDVAVLSARVKGWRTQTFLEKVSIHHRPMSSANHRNRILASFKQGQGAWVVGYHPLWQLFRSAYQMVKEPYVVGGLGLAAGYFWAMVNRKQRVSEELIELQHREQMKRLRQFFSRRIVSQDKAL